MNNESFLQQRLDKRNELGLLRSLKVHDHLIDFCSNDYLGFARSPKLKKNLDIFGAEHPSEKIGSTGSRLLAGNTRFAEELEQSIANYHHAKAGLIFNSGYDANIGFFSSVPQHGQIILFDELIHASVHDGMRLSKAESLSFLHSDLYDLEKKLKEVRKKNAANEVFVAVESVYSMDGDLVPLNEIVTLCERFNAKLMVDEAHATGVVGTRGEGLVTASGSGEKVFARLHTFGKALGCHGAIILGSNALRDYLINFARSFIYSTALPFHSLGAIRCTYDFLPGAHEERKGLTELIHFFHEKTSNSSFQILKSFSPVQSVIIPGNENAKRVAIILQQAGFDVRPILSPTVPRGKERLRICLHAFNTRDEVSSLVDQLKQISSVASAG